MAKKTSRRTAKPAHALPPQHVADGGIPRVPFGVAPTLTHELIARRAFDIHCSGDGGSELDDWLRAERELCHELGIHDPRPSAAQSHGDAVGHPSEKPT